MKKLLFLLTIVCTFVLVGCKKKSKQLKNGELSDEQYAYLFTEVTTGFLAVPNLFFDEKTFASDKNDSNYEIGYVFEFSGYELEEYDDDPEDDNYVYMGSIDHYKVKRDKETKEIVDFIDYENDESGNTYQIKYCPVDMNFLLKKGFYKLTYTAYDEYGNFDDEHCQIDKITKDEAIANVKLDFWAVPNSDVKIIEKTSESGHTYPELNVTLKGESSSAVFFRTLALRNNESNYCYAVSMKNVGNKEELKLLITSQEVDQKLRDAYKKN